MKAIFVSACIFQASVSLFAHPENGEHKGDSLASREVLQTGNGKWRYESVPNWSKLKEGKSKLGALHGGVVVDKKGLIYMSTETPEGIVVFNPSGEFERSLGVETQGTHGIQIVEEGGKEVLYVADKKKERALKLDLEGNILLEIKETEEQPIPKTLKGLTSVVSAPDGSIFVAVGYGSSFIHKFDAEGKLLKTFGGRGPKNGKFLTCHGMAIDTRFDEGKPRLLVCNREKRRLDHLTLDGEFISVYANQLRRPCNVSIKGNECAVAELEGRVTIVSKEGTHLAFLGDNPDDGQWANFGVPTDKMKPQFFTAPHGLAFDAEGNIFVQDWNQYGRLTKLKKLPNPIPTERKKKKAKKKAKK